MDETYHSSDLNQLFFNTLIEPAMIIDKRGIITAVNPSWLDAPIYSGAKLIEYIGVEVKSLFENQDEFLECVEKVLAAEVTCENYEMIHSAYEGKQTYNVRITLMLENQNKIAGAHLIFFNITNQKNLEKMLKNEAEQYRLIANHSKDMIKVTDIQGKVEYASPSHEHILGYTNETEIFQFIHPDDVESIRDMYYEIITSKKDSTLELRKQNKDGQWVWLETIASPVISDEGGVQKLLFISRDISERKKFQDELERMAFHDHLTGLYNRRKMRMIMNETLEEVKSINNQFAILIMDLDGFKSINDTYGHDVGDLVLIEFSKRLLQSKKACDFAGRLGGDEFALVMKDITGPWDVQVFIEQFRLLLNKRFDLSDLSVTIPIRASIGYSVYLRDGESLSDLLKRADIALYMEKRKPIKVLKNKLQMRYRPYRKF